MPRLFIALAGLLLVLAAFPLAAVGSPPEEARGRAHGPADGLGDRPGHPDKAFGEDYIGDRDGDDERPTKVDPNRDDDWDGLDGRTERRLGSDPLEEDSDGDGLLDGEEDPDRDGLTSEDEASAGLDPGRADSDRDGASDTLKAARSS